VVIFFFEVKFLKVVKLTKEVKKVSRKIAKQIYFLKFSFFRLQQSNLGLNWNNISGFDIPDIKWSRWLKSERRRNFSAAAGKIIFKVMKIDRIKKKSWNWRKKISLPTRNGQKNSFIFYFLTFLSFHDVF
jgi:hypothetical protein